MAEPSKVIHVRNVGQEISEDDLLQLLRPFGGVTKIVMIRSKNQALLQMEEIDSSVQALEYYANVQPNVKGRNVYLQFSSHQELTTVDQNSGENNSQFRHADQELAPNRILLVTINHMSYPITVEILQQVFSSFGFVQKIVTFQKSAGFQALIQYEEQQNAIQAFDGLQGRNIYDGCCQIDIQYSNLEELQVNYNGERSRDFTNPNLPVDQRSGSSHQQSGYNEGGGVYGYRHEPRGPYLQNQMSGGYGKSTLLVTNFDPDRMDEDKIFNLFSMYGNIIRIKILRNKPDHALVQMTDNYQAELAINCLRGAKLFGKKIEVGFSKHSDITPSPDTKDYTNSSLSRFHSLSASNFKHCSPPTRTLHLSSLPRSALDADVIAHLSGCDLGTDVGSGGAVNVRIFEVNGKRQGLVGFESEEAASEVLVEKHGSVMDGNVLRISFSQTAERRSNN